MAIKHTTQTVKPNDGTKDVSANAWNEDHTITPDTIAHMLSDHNKAAHDALGINADTLDGTHAAGFAPALGADDNYVTDAQKTVIGNTSGTNTGDNATNTQYSGLAASKQDALGFTPENVANKSTSVTTDGASDTKYPSVKSVKDYADGLVAGLLDYRGVYNASGNTYPAAGGSGTAGAILKGDIWVISVAGTLSSKAIQVGDYIIANVDAPGQTEANWDKLNTNITYTPEDSANKVTSISGSSTDAQYPSAKLLYDQLAGKQAAGSYAAALGADDNYVTDAEKTVIGNTSGTNTGDASGHSGLVVGNGAITGATKTKITYDTKGLVTTGADATTADIADSSDKRYCTDAQKTVIGNTSGTNTGDNATNTQYSGLATSKQDALGFTPENVANKSTSVTTDGASDTKYPSVKSVKDYADGLVAGLLDYRGVYNASGNAYPTTGGSGTAGAILKGDIWVISVAGTLSSKAIQVGDYIIANADTPAQVEASWDKLNTNITYTPEDAANKVTSISGASTDVQYASAKLLYDQLAGKQAAGSYAAALGADDNYVTDAEKVVIGNTSGTNTGDSATPAETATTTGTLINAATGKTTPVDADNVAITDSAASNILKKLTWANLKATLKTYFDGIYVTKEVASIWLGAESAYLPATNPAVFTEVPGATTFAGWSYLAFDDTTAQTAVWRVPLADYNNGNISVTAYSKPQTTPGVTKKLQYNIFTIGLAHDEEFNAAALTDTGVDITHTLGTTTLNTEVNIASGVIDPTNVAQDDMLLIGIQRDVSVADNLGGNGQLLGISLRFSKV